MKIAEWIIWGIGAGVLVSVTGLLIQAIPTGAMRRYYGRVLLSFILCSGSALGVTAFTEFSKWHLLWMLPAGALFSLVVALRRRDYVPSQIKADRTPHTQNGIYFRANEPVTIDSVRETFAEFPIEQHGDYIGVRLPKAPGQNTAPKPERMSKLLDTDVVLLGFEGAMDCLEFHHWQSGRHIRSLVYGMEDERVWERADGTPEPWERDFLFHPKNMECELADAEDDEERETIRQIYGDARIEVGQTVPSISSKMTAEAIAQHYGFPHYGL